MIPGSVRIPTVIDSKLRVDANYLGADLTEQILDELTIINRAKKRAERKNRPGWWNMPDDFLLADLDGDILVMPVGYAMEYKLLLRTVTQSGGRIAVPGSAVGRSAWTRSTSASTSRTRCARSSTTSSASTRPRPDLARLLSVALCCISCGQPRRW
jgi:hypothetical protein